MSTISSLSLQNIRCFAQHQRVDLGKVSLLVGENSSGKSTFLGCYAAFARLADFCNLHDSLSGQDTLLFEEPPYAMGNFQTIARDGKDSFELDGTLEDSCQNRIRFQFGARHGHPSERSVEIRFSDDSQGMDRRLRIRRNFGPPEIWRCDIDDSGLDIPQTELSYREISTWISASVLRHILPFGGDLLTYRKQIRADTQQLEQFVKVTNSLRTLPFNSSPISVQSVSPEGRPRLRQYAEDPLDIADNEPLRRSLSRFGNKLGLFADIAVMRISETQTFALQVFSQVGGAI